eukprot:5509938-Amphidinium_carterae.2
MEWVCRTPTSDHAITSSWCTQYIHDPSLADVRGGGQSTRHMPMFVSKPLGMEALLLPRCCETGACIGDYTSSHSRVEPPTMGRQAIYDGHSYHWTWWIHERQSCIMTQVFPKIA